MRTARAAQASMICWTVRLRAGVDPLLAVKRAHLLLEPGFGLLLGVEGLGVLPVDVVPVAGYPAGAAFGVGAVGLLAGFGDAALDSRAILLGGV